MTKLPAGDTGRHVYRCAGCDAQEGEVHRDGCQYLNEAMDARAWRKAEVPIDSSILWDRLRADLNNLGAVTISGEDWVREGFPEAAIPAGEMVTQASIQMAMNRLWLKHVKGEVEGDLNCPGCPPAGASAKPDPLLSQADLNLYYDGIILAARKKREALAWLDEPLTDDERDICHQMWDEQERAERVASALSKPLDHEPRLGWKPGDCE